DQWRNAPGDERAPVAGQGVIEIAAGDVEGAADVGDGVGVDAIAAGEGEGDDSDDVDEKRRAYIEESAHEVRHGILPLAFHRAHSRAFLREVHGGVGCWAMISRREFIAAGSACAASMMLAASGTFAQAGGNRPNIVLILADDL